MQGEFRLDVIALGFLVFSAKNAGAYHGNFQRARLWLLNLVYRFDTIKDERVVRLSNQPFFTEEEARWKTKV
jgi:hypothetical protein